jgi:hypothetical protein
MKKVLSGLALMLWQLVSLAQAPGIDVASPAAPANFETERARLETERMTLEAGVKQQEAACYARFAVADCLYQVRVQRRAAMEQLKKQEIVLNAAERKLKAEEQLERLKAKTSPQQLEEEAARRLEALAAQQEREDRAVQKAKDAALPTPGTREAKPGEPAPDSIKNQQQYQDKLKEADEHRASRQKSNQENSGAPAKPLPAPR